MEPADWRIDFFCFPAEDGGEGEQALSLLSLSLCHPSSPSLSRLSTHTSVSPPHLQQPFITPPPPPLLVSSPFCPLQRPSLARQGWLQMRSALLAGQPMGSRLGSVVQAGGVGVADSGGGGRRLARCGGCGCGPSFQPSLALRAYLGERDTLLSD